MGRARSAVAVLCCVFLFCTVVSSIKLALPSYITPCHRSDPNLNECVVRNGQAAIPSFIHGDPEYRVPSIDPLDIERLAVRQGTRQVGLMMVMSKIKMHGMGNAEFTRANVDLKKRTMEWEFRNEKGLQILGPYNASGQVLLLPITGSGKANITLVGLKGINYKLNYNLIKKKGREFMNITSGDMKFNVGRAYFNFENLFNGDKLLGDNMNRFLNENWRELVDEFAPEVGGALTEVFSNTLAGIMSQVPFDVVFPE